MNPSLSPPLSYGLNSRVDWTDQHWLVTSLEIGQLCYIDPYSNTELYYTQVVLYKIQYFNHDLQLNTVIYQLLSISYKSLLSNTLAPCFCSREE